MNNTQAERLYTLLDNLQANRTPLFIYLLFFDLFCFLFSYFYLSYLTFTTYTHFNGTQQLLSCLLFQYAGGVIFRLL